MQPQDLLSLDKDEYDAFSEYSCFCWKCEFRFIKLDYDDLCPICSHITYLLRPSNKQFENQLIYPLLVDKPTSLGATLHYCGDPSCPGGCND